MNTTANRIKKLRKKAGLNQSQLAQQTGISEQSISKYERGQRNPKIENLEVLANFFKVPVSYLRGESNPNRFMNWRKHSMTKANIFIYTHPSPQEIGVDAIEQHEVDDYYIKDQVVIAKECGEKWIYPLTSIMGIEELKNDVEL